MGRLSTLASISSVFVATLLLAVEAQAGHHRWDFTEVFSNDDGTVQFVELFSGFTGEHGLNGWTITSTSGGTFTFVGNLPGNSLNTWVLVGTTGYALAATEDSAPAPDYTLPDGFLEPASDTVNYASGADTWAVSSVPTNGVDSMNRTGGVMTNSPRNFAGATGSIDVSEPPPPPVVPAIGTLGLVTLVGLLLFAASGIVRRSGNSAAA